MDLNRRIKRLLAPFSRLTKLGCILNSKILFLGCKFLGLNSEAKFLDIGDIERSRSRDTIFIMGSGYSINNITAREWQHFVAAGDILSFNEFYKGKFLPINYHICGEISQVPNFGMILTNRKYKNRIESYYREIFANPFFRGTTFFLRFWIDNAKEPIPVALWALNFLKAFNNKRVCLYRIIRPKESLLGPSNSIEFISHNYATLFDAINISYILGYKNIILVGVDLYDRRYFWLGKDETHDADLKRNASYSDIHATADNVIKGINEWNTVLLKRGIKLYIYNPHSLLNAILPIYYDGLHP